MSSALSQRPFAVCGCRIFWLCLLPYAFQSKPTLCSRLSSCSRDSDCVTSLLSTKHFTFTLYFVNDVFTATFSLSGKNFYLDIYVRRKETSKCALSCVTTKSCDDNTEPSVPAVLSDSNSHRALGSVLLVGRTQHVVRWASLSGQYSPTVLRQLMDGWRRVLLPVLCYWLGRKGLTAPGRDHYLLTWFYAPPHRRRDSGGERRVSARTHTPTGHPNLQGWLSAFIFHQQCEELELLSPPDGGESNYTNATDVCIQLLTLCCNLLELLQFV